MLITIAISVAASFFVTRQYCHREIVIIDLKELVTYEQVKTQKMDREQAVQEVGAFFDSVTKDLQTRKELVLLKEAVLNAEQFRNITEEYKR